MKRTYYVIFDTNVIVSMLFSSDINSYPMQLMNYVYDGTIIPIYSDDIINEYKEVLSRDKFPFTKKMIGDLINYIKKLGINISPEKLELNFDDYDDLIFYEVLMTKSSYNKCLVTGNIKHFPKQRNILTPREMVEFIKKH
ncbi:MAG: putative toxin-antitoxin system toxin component, PIN family [Lachnospiraceae bacterium]|nr:putative toxin-antitoxin system toxin component, PIN family [Lachnospiraceae bacterium]